MNPTPCTYQVGTIECRGDGFLWDADYDGFDPAEQDNPCPNCNTRTYLEHQKEEVEQTITLNRHTGEGLWQKALRCAAAANFEAAYRAVIEIGAVNPLQPSDNSEGVEPVPYSVERSLDFLKVLPQCPPAITLVNLRKDVPPVVAARDLERVIGRPVLLANAEPLICAKAGINHGDRVRIVCGNAFPAREVIESLAKFPEFVVLPEFEAGGTGQPWFRQHLKGRGRGKHRF